MGVGEPEYHSSRQSHAYFTRAVTTARIGQLKRWTYISITVEETKSQTTSAELGLDGVLLALSPWHGNNLGVILPRLLAQDGRDEELQVCSHSQQYNATN